MAARTMFACMLLSVLAIPMTGSAQTQSSFVWQPPVPITNPPEILFSISPGKMTWWPPVGHGDVLSNRGSVVATNAKLLHSFNPPDRSVDYGLDAMQELSWGAMPTVMPVTFFSVNTGFQDKNLGWISDGDLLANTGRIVARNKDLMSNFHPMPPLQDMGLDAVFVPYFLPTALANSILPPEIWFSTTKSWFDEQLGRYISDGDLLSSRGYIVAANRDLLRNFQPVPEPTASGSLTILPQNYGLDAAYVPFYRPWYGLAVTDAATAGSGVVISPLPLEIWFSVRKGFTDNRGFAVSDGDLLSTTGRVVRTNAQLLQNFPNPTETPIQLNYGLDAVHVRCRNIVRTFPPMDATMGKVADNKVQLVFDGQAILPASAAVSVVSVASGQDVTDSFDVSLASTDAPNDTLVIAERGAALANAGRYRIQPTDALAVEPFELDVGKLVGDVDGSGAVNMLDLLGLADSWGKRADGEGFDAACDFNNDGSVDMTDLLIFADNWGR